MNIRLRLTLWYTAILFFILMIFSVAVYIGLNRSLFGAIDAHLQREAGQIIEGIEFEHGEHEEDDDDHSNAETYPSGFGEVEIKMGYVPEKGIFWRILDSQGHPLIDPGYFDNISLTVDASSAEYDQFAYATLPNNIPIRFYTLPVNINRQSLTIQVAESYQHIQEVQGQLVFLMVLGIPFTLLAANLGGWFLATRALAPIDRITRTARQISADDLHQRLNLELPNDELGRLAATFDQMLARLEDAFDQQKRFIADASHEMRTPLTILKGDVEVALNRSRSAQAYRKTLEMVNETTDRLIALVQELFLLARTDNKQYPLELQRVNLAKLLTTEASKLRPHALKKEVALNLDTPDELFVKADLAKLSRLFVNLIDNAIKYSNPGDTVNMAVATQNGQACVSISDTGPGISPEHLPHVFDRFYRVDQARSRQTPNNIYSSGAGLGLSIAQSLAQMHGGRIEVTSQIEQGTTFTVWLPLHPSS